MYRLHCFRCFRCNTPLCWITDSGPIGLPYCDPCKELEDQEDQQRQSEYEAQLENERDAELDEQ